MNDYEDGYVNAVMSIVDGDDPTRMFDVAMDDSEDSDYRSGWIKACADARDGTLDSNMINLAAKKLGKQLETAKRKSNWLFGSMCGYLVHWGLTSLAMDQMGQEKMVEAIRSEWVDPIITVPMAIIFLLIAVIGYWAVGREKS